MIVGFSRPHGFKIFSLLIRAFQGGTDYSHCYLKFNMVVGRTLRTIVAEASYGEVHLISLDEFEKRNLVVDEFKFKISESCKDKALNYIADNLQRPYSMKNILGIVFKRYFGIKDPFSDHDSGFICSELVLRALADKIELKNPDTVTPADIYKAIQYDQSFQKLQ